MAVTPIIEESWKRELADQFASPYFEELKTFLIEEKKRYRIFPPGNLIFNAFNLTPFDKVKVVILGQDPYHGYGQAHGLCFSVQPGVPHPKSLINIFQELRDDIGCEIPVNGNLEKWAQQGVLMLNATLTVREHQAGSHQNHGWETFTNAAIQQLSAKKNGIVFLLWGAYAQAKETLIDSSKHFILKTAHPSPLSAYRGFFGCKHFSQTNQLLQQSGQTPIDWNPA
ncbi:MAG TPA: uracil-DNA glycosylase [Bacteroidales bacterium]|nr:uracil-DNA glycosylase [Bacteroidales bacterium]HPT53038.1 uracil-DNA glycosylase [Bacteroidales bacterium]